MSDIKVIANIVYESAISTIAQEEYRQDEIKQFDDVGLMDAMTEHYQYDVSVIDLLISETTMALSTIIEKIGKHAFDPVMIDAHATESINITEALKSVGDKNTLIRELSEARLYFMAQIHAMEKFRSTLPKGD
jgi:hypothetical protein